MTLAVSILLLTEVFMMGKRKVIDSFKKLVFYRINRLNMIFKVFFYV